MKNLDNSVFGESDNASEFFYRLIYQFFIGEFFRYFYVDLLCVIGGKIIGNISLGGYGVVKPVCFVAANVPLSAVAFCILRQQYKADG